MPRRICGKSVSDREKIDLLCKQTTKPPLLDLPMEEPLHTKERGHEQTYSYCFLRGSVEGRAQLLK